MSRQIADPEEIVNHDLECLLVSETPSWLETLESAALQQPPDRPNMVQVKAKLKSVCREYGHTVLTQGGLLALGVVTGIVSARLLGPVGRGELAAVTVWPMALVFLLSLGVNQSVVYHTGKQARSVSEIFTATLGLGLAQGLVVVALGALLLPFNLHNYSWSVKIIGLFFLASTPALIVSGYPANIFQGLQRSSLFNIIRACAPVCYFAGMVVLSLVHRVSLVTVVGVQAFAYFFAAAFGYGILIAQLRPKIDWKPAVTRQLLGFGLRAQAANVSNYFNQRVDQLIMAMFVRPAELGLYVVAVTLATAVTFFSQASGIVTLGRASSVAPEAVTHVISKSVRLSLFWLACACTALFFAAPLLITKVFGAQYSGSILACRILLPGMVALGLNQVLYNGACALGRPLLSAYAEGVGMITTAVGLALFLPRYGYIGAAAVSTVAYTTTLVVMLMLLRAKAGLSIWELFHLPSSSKQAEVHWQARQLSSEAQR
jgi:O-antigen/teichoic acid export membrane protein